MKKIIVTQRYFKDLKTGEVRDSIDIRLSEFLLKLNLFPIYIPNSLGSSPYLNLKKLINNLNRMACYYQEVKILEKILVGQFRKISKIFYSKEKTDLRNLRGNASLSSFFGSQTIKVKNHVRTRHKCKIQTSDKLFPKTIKCYHNYAINKCPKNFFITLMSEDGQLVN